MNCTKRTTRTRLLGLACSAVAVTLANGCVLEFAAIDLVLHQSVDPERRRDEPGNNLAVTYVLDEVVEQGEGARVVNGFSFASDGVLQSPPQRLKPNPQIMTMALAVGVGSGFGLDKSRAVGRVDPLLVPSVDDGAGVQLFARGFLAAPDAIEILDDATPAGGAQAVCDNRAGHVNAVGGEAAYGFDLDDLALVDNEAGFSTDGDNIIVCDVADVVEGGALKDEEGPVIVAHGVCVDDVGTYTLVLDVGGANEQTLPPQEGELCDPFLRVVTVEDGALLIWVAGRSFAALFDEAGRLLGRQAIEPPLTGPVRHVLLDNGVLIASGFDNVGAPKGVIIRRISDAALQPSEEALELDQMIAGDPSGRAGLFEEGNATDGSFSLRVPQVGDDGNVVSYADSRPVQFEAPFVPTRILVLGGDDADFDNDVVVGMNNAGDTQIEGGALHTNTQRDRFAVAFGRSIILAGNGAGHDVLVRAFDEDEIELLETRTRN